MIYWSLFAVLQLMCVMSDLLSVATEQLAFLYLYTGVRFHFRLSPDSEVVTITKCILFLNFTLNR